MAAGSTRHIEPLLPAEAAAAVEQIPDRLRHQVHAGFEPPHNFWLAGWQPPHETPVAPVVKRPPEHLVLLGTTPLPQGEFSDWRPTRDTTPKTSRLDHQVTLALTPLPRGDFYEWGPTRDTTPKTSRLDHQVTLAEDLRRLQRFRLERHGGPAGVIEPPVEDTTRIVPHQSILAPSRYPEGDFASWTPPPQVVVPLRPSFQVIPAPSRYPEGGFVRWGPPPTFVPPVEIPRVVPLLVVSAPSRYPEGDFFTWGPPPRLPVVQPNAPRFQVIPVPTDRRGLYRFAIIRHGGPAGFEAPGPDTVPACVAVADGDTYGLALADTLGGAVSLADGSGQGVAVADTTGQIVSVEDATDDVEMDDGNPC